MYEFRFGGEDSSGGERIALFDRNNTAGTQKEWWYHRDGCREWLVAVRNTVTNQVSSMVDAHQ